MKKIISFFSIDIWRIRKSGLDTTRAFFLTMLRVVVLSFRGFAEDKCMLRASALTFFSLLSIVPVFAMAFGIAKGFGFETKLEEIVMARFQGQEEVLSRVIEFSRTMLENTKGGVIAGIGIALLFWTVIKVLGNIESAFNDIWGIKNHRSLVRKFSDYLAIMLICPMLLILSSSITVFIKSQVELIVNTLSILGPVSSLIYVLLNLLPFCVLWVVFSFIYIAMPNTKVKLTSGLFAGVLIGTVYQIVQWGYITFQVGAAKYGAIYGSFAALPLFLMWLQLSWLVVLVGAEFSFAYQNVDTYELEPDCKNVSVFLRKIFFLRIMCLVVKRFEKGQSPFDAAQISHELDIPIRLVNELVFDLCNSKLLIETKTNNEKVSAYQPAQDPEKLDLAFVIEQVDKSGHLDLLNEKNEDYLKIETAVDDMYKSAAMTSSNFKFKDFA